MATMIMRFCATKLLNKQVSRGFHATGVKRMCAHRHDESYDPEHMYKLDRMKFRKLTMILGVFTAVSIFVGVPAIIFQQKKTAPDSIKPIS